VATFRPDPGDGFARLVGAILVAQAVLVGVSRLLTLVYVVAGQVYRPDEEHVARSAYLPYVLSAIAFVAILGWAGGQLRSTPGGAWRAGRVPARVDLVLAALLNAVVLGWAIVELIHAGRHAPEGIAAWAVAAAVTLAVLAGMIRDAAGLARPTAAR
jgi:hypothetical protein